MILILVEHPVRECRWNDDHNGCDRHEYNEYGWPIEQQRTDHLQGSSDRPDFSGQRMCGIPVRLIFQCPWQLESGQIILFEFGHVNAHSGKSKTQQGKYQFIDLNAYV